MNSVTGTISVSGLHIYPVKSLAGIDLDEVYLDRFGPRGDRRWMLIDEAGIFVTQRECPHMALIAASPGVQGLTLRHGHAQTQVAIPAAGARTWQVDVWQDTLQAVDAGDAAASWLSEQLGLGVRLVHMAEDCRRLVDTDYASAGETISFADGFPLLLVAQASLDDLNSRLSSPVPMNRFRPNLVVQGCEPFAEDQWRRLRIGAIEFTVAKPCSRCSMPSIDQATGVRDGEITRVLASYRRAEDRQIYFGQNVLHGAQGSIALGDSVEIIA